MSTDETKSAAAPLVGPDFVHPALAVTSGERARAALAGVLIKFAEENLPEITDADFQPHTDAVDFENVRKSLLNHPCVKKAVRIVASVAAQSQNFELRVFERLHFAEYVAECEAEIASTSDPALRKERLEGNLRAAKVFYDATPACRAELLSYAKTNRSNVEYSMGVLLKFCIKTAGDWFDAIPADSVRELRETLERLATAPLRAQMAYFGLLDMMPAGDLPQEAAC
jgi:hypothetical protein